MVIKFSLTIPTSESSEIDSTNIVTPTVTEGPRNRKGCETLFFFCFCFLTQVVIFCFQKLATFCCNFCTPVKSQKTDELKQSGYLKKMSYGFIVWPLLKLTPVIWSNPLVIAHLETVENGRYVDLAYC